MRLIGRIAIASVLALAFADVAAAQTTFPTPAGSSANGAVAMCPSTASAALKVPCDSTNPLAVTVAGGGGSGAATIADGADVAQGTTTDAACATDNGTCTEIALLKRANQRLTTAIAGTAVTNAGTFPVQAAQSGTWTVQPGNTANSTAWLVTGTGGTFPVTGTVAVTQSTSPWIVAGGGTAGTAATGVLTVQGIASMTKLLVTPDSVALPANQSVNVSQINGVTPLMGNGVTGTGSHRVTLASDGTAISTTGFMSVKFDQTTPGTTNAVSLAQIGGTTIVNGGLAGSQSVGGTVATNVAITDNPVNMGGQGVSSENTAITTGRKVQFVADLVGKQIVLPYANPENFVSGTTAAMTGTTSTSLVASPGGSLRNYITHISCVNSHATVGTFVTIQDGSGGTNLMTLAAGSVYGGESVALAVPLRQPTTATALFVANVTTGANVICNAVGYKGV